MAKTDTDDRMPNVKLENANILPGRFRNFAGKEGPYNREGDRFFNIALPPEVADDMRRDGWNVKQLKPREDDDVPQDIIEVAVKFGRIPPKIVLYTTKSQTKLDEESVSTLDWVRIQEADVILRPYEWAVNGKTGVKAYLKELRVKIDEETPEGQLEAKWANYEVDRGESQDPGDRYPDDSRFD